jgi:peptidoglycan-associated lipoprotein
MKRLIMFTFLVMALVLVGCASPGNGVGNGVVSDSPGQQGTMFATRDISDTDAYPPGTRPGGDQVGGRPGATGANRNIVYFDFDSVTVRSDSRPVIEAQARFLTSNPSTPVILEGHTDERGTREYNIALGDRRAHSVRQLLIASGVSPRQLQTVSYGEERPAALGRDETSYARNRRVEFSY